MGQIPLTNPPPRQKLPMLSFEPRRGGFRTDEMTASMHDTAQERVRTIDYYGRVAAALDITPRQYVHALLAAEFAAPTLNRTAIDSLLDDLEVISDTPPVQ